MHYNFPRFETLVAQVYREFQLTIPLLSSLGLALQDHADRLQQAETDLDAQRVALAGQQSAAVDAVETLAQSTVSETRWMNTVLSQTSVPRMQSPVNGMDPLSDSVFSLADHLNSVWGDIKALSQNIQLVTLQTAPPDMALLSAEIAATDALLYQHARELVDPLMAEYVDIATALVHVANELWQVPGAA